MDIRTDRRVQGHRDKALRLRGPQHTRGSRDRPGAKEGNLALPRGLVDAAEAERDGRAVPPDGGAPTTTDDGRGARGGEVVEACEAGS